MKTEIERICEIMETLLAHEPIIDVPYEKINDIAVALVKEGYGDISEYKTEREMLGSQIKVLKQRLNDKYIEVDNINRDYRNSFERLKAQEREIEQLKAENEELTKVMSSKVYDFVNKIIDETNTRLEIEKQAKIDVLNELKERTYRDSVYYPEVKYEHKYVHMDDIDEMIEELKQ